jgi:hypothetical protein
VHEEARESRIDSNERIQRAVLLALLSRPARQHLTLAQLADELQCDVDDIDRALALLVEAGVACVEGEQAWASAAARHIDELGLVGI